MNSIEKYQAICILLTLGLIFESCSYVYYTPNQPNVPVLRNRNDFEIKGSFSGEAFGEVEAIEAQISYSPLKYWSVNVNSAYFFSDQSHINRGNGKHLEFGTGAYFPLTKHVYLNCNLDYSFTDVHLTYDSNISSSYIYSRWSVTPGFQFGNEIVNVFGGIRISRLQFANGIISYNTPEQEKAELEYILTRPYFNLIEPTIGVKGGYKFIFLGFQFTRCYAGALYYESRSMFSPSMTSLTLSINQEIFRFRKDRKNSSESLGF